MTKNLSSLLSSIENVRAQTVISDIFEVREVTLQEQRDLLMTISNPIEVTAKLNIAFDNIINKCVNNINGDKITVVEKPYLLRAIRDLSIDKVFKKDGEEYEFKSVDYKLMKNIEKSKNISLNSFINITLSAPSLNEDIEINKLLIRSLNGYIQKLEGQKDRPDAGYIAAQYYIYELVKFIEKININDEEYIFNNLLINEQIKVIESLPQKYISVINEFITKLKIGETDAFIAVNKSTNKEEIIPINQTIFSNDISL